MPPAIKQCLQHTLDPLHCEFGKCGVDREKPSTGGDILLSWMGNSYTWQEEAAATHSVPDHEEVLRSCLSLCYLQVICPAEFFLLITYNPSGREMKAARSQRAAVRLERAQVVRLSLAIPKQSSWSPWSHFVPVSSSMFRGPLLVTLLQQDPPTETH